MAKGIFNIAAIFCLNFNSSSGIAKCDWRSPILQANLHAALIFVYVKNYRIFLIFENYLVL
jgi:hypothetical protein